MEPIYRNSYVVRNCDVDRYGRLKPSMVLFYAQDVAGKHCSQLALDCDTLAEKRLFWAIIRHRVQITRLPGENETITVETWPMPTTRTAYPRSTVAYDEDGNELFRAIALWVLMDLDTRDMIVPGKSGVHVEGLLRGSELAVPHCLIPASLGNRRSRQVCFTDLDRNGHMNNCRYMDWMEDLLPGDFHRDHTVKEFTVCYLQEAREGDTLDMSWQLCDGGVLQIEAHRQENESVSAGHSRVFSARILL